MSESTMFLFDSENVLFDDVQFDVPDLELEGLFDLSGLSEDPLPVPRAASPSYGSLPLGSPSFSTDTTCSQSTACNNKSSLDAKWGHLNSLSTTELNRYLRVHTELSESDIVAIKQSRRRFKSRGYSKTAREKRSAIDSQSTASFSFMASPHDLKVLRQAQAELQAAQQRVHELTLLLQSRGIPLPE
jgi:hypothetical protein